MNVCCAVLPGDIVAESNAPEADLIECGAASSFAHTTVSPFLIVMSAGSNAKFLICTVWVVAVWPVAEGEPEGAPEGVVDPVPVELVGIVP